MATTTTDIVIIGSGMGGATAALGLAPTGANITILERGSQIAPSALNRDARAVYQRNHFKSDGFWYLPNGEAFPAGNRFCHGGMTKFYGGVLYRFRERDFDGVSYTEGDALPWPIRYAELEPWYEQAERLYQVRGDSSQDPTEPPRRINLPYPPVPDEEAISQARARFEAIGLHPGALPLGIDLSTWLRHGKTGWDGFPDAREGKMDAENCALIPALNYPNVRIKSGAVVQRVLFSPDGKRAVGVEYESGDQVQRLHADVVVLAAGAIPTAAILLASDIDRTINRSGQVGRNLMAHNQSIVIGFDWRFRNDSIYQKTFAINDFYLSDGAGGPPLGNIQALGRVNGAILKAGFPRVPEWLLSRISKHTLDFFLNSEDLPHERNQVRLDGRKLVLDFSHPTNMLAHKSLTLRWKDCLRDAGFHRTGSMLFERRGPGHQSGTVRMGDDPNTAPLNRWGQAHECENLFITDASPFVSSAAVNPALTVAALSLRAVGKIKDVLLKG
ncbi:GMC family oxidoreductase [Paraburkholderia sp. RL18-103-BIB-C]|jgi:choline dehydrogenase-like flavoprotein|uniref:FAD-dependent oxidoreductase n=1 Tax=unclassified Paraburkholderia TaxID=2615204 RepID=UPI0038BB17C9